MARRKQLSESEAPRPGYLVRWSRGAMLSSAWVGPQAHANSNWLEQWVLNEIASSCWSISYNSSNTDRRS